MNKLKVLKRHGYHRVNVDLLSKRVLYRDHFDSELHQVRL